MKTARRATQILVPEFSKHARVLRNYFDERFADPRSTDGGRFVWDYWHVPGQYTALRTPAWHFFPTPLYRELHEALVIWGRKNLGCHDISPPWLSCYVEGCRQELHGDLPHGPFAFVFSLTPWRQRKFRGGETLLVNDKILDLWQNLDRFRGMEEPDILTEIPARFNQLLVFDPRIPHGVRRVEGVHDPREGRLVIHGWFVQPRPYIEGPLKRSALQQAIRTLSSHLAKSAAESDHYRGILILRFRVTAAGTVTSAKTVRSTLVSTTRAHDQVQSFEHELLKYLRTLKFGKQKSTSEVTLPISFDSD